MWYETMRYTLNDYDLVLTKLIKELKKQNINLTNYNGDGRINSIISLISFLFFLWIRILSILFFIYQKYSSK